MEETLLKEFLAQIPYPEQALSYYELMGFMYGLAISPVVIPASEWLPAIFGDDDESVPAEAKARGMELVLQQVYDTFKARKLRGTLIFPYQVETLQDHDLEEVAEWASGFEEALSLRPQIWEPDNQSDVPKKIREELFFSLMIIQGLNEPVDIMPFFDKLSDELFTRTFPSFQPQAEDRELQIQAVLIASLPLAVQILQEYAASYESGTRPRPWQDGGAPPAKPAAASTGGKVIKVDFRNRRRG